ncbi:MAG: argininosuccinate lyase [Ignavibacteriaceae bacterium]
MLWGSRFNEKIDDSALEFSSSLSFDINLIKQDILVSKAHTEMLAFVGLIEESESKKIVDGLNLIESEYFAQTWDPEPSVYEDIHSAVEARLFEIIGPVAKKLHTGRSRNDQVAADLRLWTKTSTEFIINTISFLQRKLIELSDNHTETIMPGYTHLQRAQPVSLGFHLLAYVEMLERDKNRFKFVYDESNVSPLGSGALAGSTLPLNNEYTADKLNFSGSSNNALDAVSDRDFALDFLNACSIGIMHLSRFSEELILWSSAEWKFIIISDKFTTGSSLMPQKKNPDMAELIRGKSGRAFGNYISLLTTLKGLPLSYNRDLQEDKEPVFDSFKNYSKSLEIIAGIVSSVDINTKRFEEELKGDFFLATDLTDRLVLQGISFRDAHKIVGELVKFAEKENKKFDALSVEDMKKVNLVFDKSALDAIQLEGALYRKQTKGSPNPDFVRNEIEKWKNKLEAMVKELHETNAKK